MPPTSLRIICGGRGRGAVSPHAGYVGVSVRQCLSVVWVFGDIIRIQHTAWKNAANGLFIGVTAQSWLPHRASISLPEQGGSQELSIPPHIPPFLSTTFYFFPFNTSSEPNFTLFWQLTSASSLSFSPIKAPSPPQPSHDAIHTRQAKVGILVVR